MSCACGCHSVGGTETLRFCLTITARTMPFRIKSSSSALLILLPSLVLKCFANQQVLYLLHTRNGAYPAKAQLFP